MKHMSLNGIWGGDLEINAISNCYKCNVIIYQDRRPNIELQNFPKENRVIRLAYFGSCHYNSVRGKCQAKLSDHSTQGNIVIRKDNPSPPKQTISHSKSDSKSKSETQLKSSQPSNHGDIPVISTPKNTSLQQTSKSPHSLPSELSQISEAVQQFETSAALLRSIAASDQSLDESWKRRIQTVLTEMHLSFGDQNRELRETTESKKPSDKQEVEKPAKSAGSSPLSTKEIAKRNLRIIREFERQVKWANAHHVLAPGEWCGDLSFDDLVPFNTRLQLLFAPREKQVRGFLTLLTKKCPCRSGAYFKYCCYPKIKSW